jgi:hypothetical protein
MPDVIIAQAGALDVAEFAPEVIEVGYVAQTVAEGGGSVTSVDGLTGAVSLAAVYAALGHNHNGAYSALAHNHNALYDALGAAGAVGAALTAHDVDTTAVHGLADTSLMETQAGATSKVATHAAAADPHGDRGDLSLYPSHGHGFVAMSGDPIFYQSSGSFGSNTILFSRIWVPAGKAITGLWVACRGTVGATFGGVNSGNKVSVYDDTGANPVHSAVDDAMWAPAAPWRGAALLSTIPAQSAGRYVYGLALVRDYGGGVPFMNPPQANDSNTHVVVGVSQDKRRGGYWSGQSAMPASFNPTTVGTASGFTVCMGLTG